MNGLQPYVRWLVAPWCFLALAAIPQVSCSNWPRFDFDIAPRFDFDLNLEEAMRELYPDEEMLFIKWCSETLEADAPSQRVLKSPNVSRAVQVCFTYPAKQFPGNMPDGVWRMDISNCAVPDKRFLREPVGKESRGNTETSVMYAAIFARQRSTEATRLIGELSTLDETLRDKGDTAEYQLLSTRIVGAYDDQEKKWSLVSKSIGPVGHP